MLDAIDAATTVEHVRMAPLSAPQLTELLATVSRADTGPQLFSAWLHRRTGGNPFFALQTLRSLFESGQLRRSTTAGRAPSTRSPPTTPS